MTGVNQSAQLQKTLKSKDPVQAFFDIDNNYVKKGLRKYEQIVKKTCI